MAAASDGTIAFVRDVSEILFVADIDRMIIGVSDHALEYLGLEENEVVGKDIDSIFPAAYMGPVFSLMGLASTKNLVFDHIKKDGQKMKLDARFSWVSTGSGSEVVVMSCRDVSEHDEEIAKLTSREELFRTIFHESPLGIIHINSDGIVADCNQEFVNIYGLIQELIIGTDMAKDDQDFPIGANFRRAAINAVMGNGSTFEEKFAVKGYFGVKEGWARVAFSPIISDTNSFLGAVGIVQDITEAKEADEKIAYIGIHDALTGLFNRHACEADMVKIDRPEYYPIGIVYVDLNHLKLANDAFGHHEGDLLLTRCASILQSAASESDRCYRLGGDEFVMLLRNTGRSELKTLVSGINKACQDRQGDGIVQLSMAIGASIKRSDGQDIMEVLKEAEDMMYANKLRDGPAVRRRLMDTLESKLRSMMDGMLAARSDRMMHWCDWMLDNLPIEDDADRSALRLLCRYHDIGLLGYKDEISVISLHPSKRKPVPLLQHPVVGYRIARTVSELSSASDFILSHHENWDGSGYPSQMRGEEIPYISRAVYIFDSLEAMLCLSKDASKYTFSEAVDAIESGAGTMFDPQLVRSIAAKLRSSTPAFALEHLGGNE